MDTIEDSPEETAAGMPRHWTVEGQPSQRLRPRGRPYSRDADWRLLAMVAAGIAAGAMIGASVALLTAPQSGAHTRLALTREFRRRRPWKTSPWEQLGEELQKAARRRNRRNGSRAEELSSAS